MALSWTIERNRRMSFPKWRLPQPKKFHRRAVQKTLKSCEQMCFLKQHLFFLRGNPTFSGDYTLSCSTGRVKCSWYTCSVWVISYFCIKFTLVQHKWWAFAIFVLISIYSIQDACTLRPSLIDFQDPFSPGKWAVPCLENMRVLGSRPLHMRPWFRMRSLYVFRLRNTLYSHKDALQENHGAQDAVPDCVNVTHWPFLESTGTPNVCFVSTMIEQIFGKVLKMCQLDSEGFCPKWVKTTQKRCYFCEWNERNQWTDFWQIWMLSSWGFVMVTESCCHYLYIYNEMSLYSILVADVQI